MPLSSTFAKNNKEIEIRVINMKSQKTIDVQVLEVKLSKRPTKVI